MPRLPSFAFVADSGEDCQEGSEVFLSHPETPLARAVLCTPSHTPQVRPRVLPGTRSLGAALTFRVVSFQSLPQLPPSPEGWKKKAWAQDGPSDTPPSPVDDMSRTSRCARRLAGSSSFHGDKRWKSL